MNALKKHTAHLVLGVAALLITGCASIYKPAAVIAITAEQAMEAYGSYFDTAIADPVKYGTTETELWKQRRTVDENWERYRRTMNLFDDTRQSYLQGKATMSDVEAALVAARENSQALADLVYLFLPLQYQPAP